MNSRFQWIVFDYGNVLSDAQDPIAVSAMAAILNVSTSEFLPAYFEQRGPYDRGDIHGSEFWTRVASAIGITLRPNSVSELIELDIKSWIRTRPEVIQWANSLTNHSFNIAILSNMPHEQSQVFRLNQPWLQNFHKSILSAEINLRKPELAIYQHMLKNLGSPASRVLFLDDNHENINAANRLGIKGFLFNSGQNLREQISRVNSLLGL